MPGTIGRCIFMHPKSGRVFVLKELRKPLAEFASALTSSKPVTENVRDNRKFPE
jgi:hypothetical protein